MADKLLKFEPKKNFEPMPDVKWQEGLLLTPVEIGKIIQGIKTTNTQEFKLQLSEAVAKAQLAKALKNLKQTGIPNYNNTGKWLVDLDKA